MWKKASWLLISLLNALFDHSAQQSPSEPKQVVKKLRYLPTEKQERIFQRVFDLADIARFTPDEARIYEESLKHYRDMNNVINSAERRGESNGIQKEKVDTAHRLHAMGLTMEQIAQGTDLTVDEVKNILSS